MKNGSASVGVTLRSARRSSLACSLGRQPRQAIPGVVGAGSVSINVPDIARSRSMIGQPELPRALSRQTSEVGGRARTTAMPVLALK
jgi:hypothetical protein